MIFTFIRYTQPTWQFNLTPPVSHPFPSCYPSEEELLKAGVDEQYQSRSAQIADAGFRLCKSGHLLFSITSRLQQLHLLEPPTLQDEYRFLRKYWGSTWAGFALFVRVITFKNPVQEFRNFFATKGVRYEGSFSEPVRYPEYDTYHSTLLKEQPMVAVIIPTLNRYSYLQDVLHDLEQQRYSNFEVIVVDQSQEFNEAFYSTFSLTMKVLQQKERLLWTARNKAIKYTNAKFLLFFDDDSRVAPDWIDEHLKCLDFFNADISAGVSIATVGAKVSASYSYFRWADQFDSGNALVKREVFEQIGLFDEQFNGMRMGDAEFGLRSYLNGFKSISNYKASRVHLKVSSGGLREMGSWDGFRPKKWMAPKPVPSVIYLFKKYFPEDLSLNALLIGVMLSNVPYKQKRSTKMLVFSIVLSLIKAPLLFIQYYRSARIADEMLQHDEGVEKLTDEGFCEPGFGT